MKQNTLRIMQILAFIATVLAAYIAWTSWNDEAQLAGCGEGTGCEAVLQTKWSSWFGLPVSTGAVGVYGSLFILTLLIAGKAKKNHWLLLVFLSVLASGSGIWFMGIQALVVKNYCIYCTIVHSCGLLLTFFILKNTPVEKEPQGKRKKTTELAVPSRKFVQAGLMGIAGVVVLAAGQIFPASSSTANLTTSTPGPGVAVSAKTVSLLGGRLKLNLSDFPVVGSPDANRVIAHFFDYTCPACRKLHPELLATHQPNQQDVAIAMIPMPLDAACNPAVPQTQYIHLNACLYAKIGLAIWRINPLAYLSYDLFMFQTETPPSAEQARAAADQLVGKEAMDKALADPSIVDPIRLGITMFHSPPLERKVLPILVSPEKAVYGIPSLPELNSMFLH